MQSSEVDRRDGEGAVDQVDDDAFSHVDDGPDASAAAPVARRGIDWKLALASLPIALGLFLIGFGLVRSVTGDDVTKLPRAIEEITPTPDAVQVLAQTNVVVDLAEGYEGRLIIDGLQFETLLMQDLISNPEPGTQVDIPAGVVFERGNDTLTFTPGPDIDIERFSEGIHTVKVIYWRTELGEAADARSYPWTFNVV